MLTRNQSQFVSSRTALSIGLGLPFEMVKVYTIDLLKTVIDDWNQEWAGKCYPLDTS